MKNKGGKNKCHSQDKKKFIMVITESCFSQPVLQQLCQLIHLRLILGLNWGMMILFLLTKTKTKHKNTINE
ncbi:hypothetical protein C6W27_08470 [Bacillus paralicheniformis]|nr:hypothetical protein BLDA23_05875 [Bacillus licheniformis]PRS16431.1 hypothetical protein C6W27_08470 [Bacillus paralicheniformis]